MFKLTRVKYTYNLCPETTASISQVLYHFSTTDPGDIQQLYMVAFIFYSKFLTQKMPTILPRDSKAVFRSRMEISI